MDRISSEDRLQKRLSNWLSQASIRSGLNKLDVIDVALGTEMGLVRNENQDRVAFLRAHLGQLFKRAFIVAALCDGMGGMAQGSACADLCLSTFLVSIMRSKEDNLSKKLVVATQLANKAVYEKFFGEGGATLSAVIIDDTMNIASINVGDSRIYQVLVNGNIGQVSVDDTIGGQLLAINRSLEYRAEFNQLVQYIGMGDGLEPHNITFNSLNELRLIILSSDGAHNIASETFNSIIVNSKASKDIIERILLISKWCGGKDNATAICLPLTEVFGISIKDDSPTNLVEIWDPFGKVEFWPFYENQRSSDQPDVYKQKKQVRRKKGKGKDKSPTKELKQVEIETPEKAKDIIIKPQLDIVYSDGDK